MVKQQLDSGAYRVSSEKVKGLNEALMEESVHDYLGVKGTMHISSGQETGFFFFLVSIHWML